MEENNGREEGKPHTPSTEPPRSAAFQLASVFTPLLFLGGRRSVHAWSSTAAVVLALRARKVSSQNGKIAKFQRFGHFY